MMSTKDTAALLDNCLRVRKLTRSVHHAHIREIFGSYGRIQSVEILVDKRNGVSKGVALVSFCSLEDAENAMFYLDGGQIDGCVIEVSITERNVGDKRESAKHMKSQRKVDNHHISSETADAVNTGIRNREISSGRDNAVVIQRNEAMLRHEVSREGSMQRRVVNQRDPIAESSRGMHVQQRLDRNFVRNENRVDVVSNSRHDRGGRIPVHRQEHNSRYSGDIGAVMYGRPDSIYGNFGGRPSHAINYTVPLRNLPVELSMRHDPIRNGFRDDSRIPYAAPRLDDPNSRRIEEDSRRRSPGRYVPKDRSVMSGRDVAPRYRSRSRERAIASSRMESSSHYGPYNPANRSNDARLAPVRDRDQRIVDTREKVTRRSADSRVAPDRRIPDVRDRGRRPLDDRGRDGRRVDSRERDRRVDADSRDRNKYSRRSRSASSSLPVDPRRRRRRSNSDSSSHSSASSGSSSGSSSGKKSGRSSSRSRSSSKSTSSSSSDSHGGKDLSGRLP